MGDAAVGEEVDIVPRRVSGIADRQRADADVTLDQPARGALDGVMGAAALKSAAVEVVDVLGAVEADRD